MTPAAFYGFTLSLLLCAPLVDAQTRKPAARSPAAPAAAPPPRPLAPQTPATLQLIVVDGLNAEAKARQQEAKTSFERGQWASAVAQFDRAYAASKDSRMLWNAALAERAQKRPVRALELVTRFVKERGTALTTQERTDADALRKVLETATSKLVLTVSEPGAAVFVDEAALGVTPITTILLDPGTKRIRVTKEGFKEAVETETFSGGSTVKLEIVLQPDVHQGRLHVKAGPTDTIWLDGRVVAQGQWEAPVASGKHYVSVTAPGKRSFETETTVSGAQTREISVTLQADDGSPGRSATWILVTGGAAVLAGAAVGGYFLLKPASNTDAPMAGTFGTLQLPLLSR